MDHSLSVDEVPNSVWTVSPPMQQPQVDGDCGGVVASEDTTKTTGGQDATDGSPSEWSFERFLEEELMSNPAVDSSAGSVFHTEEPVPHDHAVEVEVEPATMAANGTADPVEYNAMLKRKLEEDLAAIAMWRASSTVNQEICQGSYAYNGGSRNLAQNESRDGRGHLLQNSDICAELPAHSSSMEPSPTDDDDMDAGEVEILGFRMPDAEKMKKRKQSNRESARRSRTRRAAHLKDLEDQVTHLRVENSLLLRRLDVIKQQYSATAVDNRILRADMETLRTKVKMAEDAVNRLLGTSSPPFSSMPFVGSPSHAILPADLSVPIQDSNNITNYYTTAASSDARLNNHRSYMPRTAPSPLQAEGAVLNGSSNNSTINRTTALHCATAMELLEERLMIDE